MSEAQPSLFSRPDTLLGICQGIGEDFGFNPNWLRVALALPIFYAPMAVFAAYGVLGVIVLTSRLIVPKLPRNRAKVAKTEATVLKTAKVAENATLVAEPLALAA